MSNTKDYSSKNRERNEQLKDVLYGEDNLNSLKTCTGCKSILPRRLFRKDLSRTEGFTTRCVDCLRAKEREWYKNSPDEKEKRKAYRHCNVEMYRKASLAYYYRNHEAQNIANKTWLENNTWYVNAQSATKRANKRKATPPWADRKAISSIYKEARKLFETTGIKYHVDHIVPLSGKNVCGLHVHYNLRIITAEENIRKSNRFSEEELLKMV